MSLILPNVIAFLPYAYVIQEGNVRCYGRTLVLCLLLSRLQNCAGFSCRLSPTSSWRLTSSAPTIEWRFTTAMMLRRRWLVDSAAPQDHGLTPWSHRAVASTWRSAQMHPSNAKASTSSTAQVCQPTIAIWQYMYLCYKASCAGPG